MRFFLIGLLFAGCHSPAEVNDSFEKKESFLELEEIAKDEVISDRVFIASLEAGDKVYIEARGWKRVPRFRQFVRSSKSHWKKEDICGGPSLGGKGCRTIWVDRSGKCELLYRKRKDDLEKNIFMEDNRTSYPLQLVMGEKVSPTPKVRVDGHRVFIEFVVEEVMLEGGNDFYLDVAKGEPREKRVGFLKYKSCDGRRGKKFRVDAPTDFKVISVRERSFFRVSVTLERKNG